MTQVHWLVEDGPFEEDIGPLLEEIKRQGHPLRTVKYEPFESGNYRDLYPENACVVFYGSINLAQQLQRQTPWVPGPLVTFDHYKCSTYFAHWGKHLLNSEYLMMPYAEVCRRRHEICRRFGHLEPEKSSLFIRPDDGRKTFGGHVAYEHDFERVGGPVGQYARPETMVVVSSPKNLYYEWRIVVCDGKAISGCQYKWADKLTLDPKVPDAVWEKANEIAACGWHPDRMYVLDIANWGPGAYGGHDGYYGQMFLIEANSFACSGFYCCDPEPIVREASRVALEEWQDIYAPI